MFLLICNYFLVIRQLSNYIIIGLYNYIIIIIFLSDYILVIYIFIIKFFYSAV